MIRTIIDAYNLIFQCGLQPKNLDSPLAMHRTRQRLVGELAERIPERRRKEVMLVFDAKNPRGYSTPDLERRGFIIEFAREYEDADAMVIELIRKHSQPKQLLVVSGDHRIQTAATRRGAKPVDSDVWFDRLGNEQGTSLEDQDAKDVYLSDAETQQLLDTFSDLDGSKKETNKPKQAGDTEKDSTYNPFPPGYGEDLLD